MMSWLLPTLACLYICLLGATSFFLVQAALLVVYLRRCGRSRFIELVYCLVNPLFYLLCLERSFSRSVAIEVGRLFFARLTISR